MITSPVTEAQLRHWQTLFREKGAALRANRVSGEALDAYFRLQFRPRRTWDLPMRRVVRLSAREQYGSAAGGRVRTYRLGRARIGIDLDSGFFQVEAREPRDCAPIWDALFLKRGLDADALQNYVIAGQYLELTERRTPADPAN